MKLQAVFRFLNDVKEILALEHLAVSLRLEKGHQALRRVTKKTANETFGVM